LRLTSRILSRCLENGEAEEIQGMRVTRILFPVLKDQTGSRARVYREEEKRGGQPVTITVTNTGKVDLGGSESVLNPADQPHGKSHTIVCHICRPVRVSAGQSKIPLVWTIR
jgi:hypothetical protein